MDNSLIKQQEEFDKMAELVALIKSNPDPRELKRAVTVKMSIEGHTDEIIAQILGVSKSFIRDWKNAFKVEGKNFLRKYWYLCKSFRAVKKLFELFYDCSKFDFPKIHQYHFTQEIS